MSGSLVACVQTGPETKSSPSTTSIPLNPDQGNSKNSFDDVQKTNNEFQTLLDDFIKDIAAVREGSKNRELVNSSQVNQRLVELEKKVKTYKNQILPTINLENLDQNFNDINQNINNIKQITEKLKGGLGEDEIGKVQIYLGIFKSPNDKNYGVLGPNTTTEINSSLTTNSGQLKAQIRNIGEIGGFIKPSAPPTNIDNLTRKIADLEARNNELAAIAKKNEEEIKNLNYEKQENYNQLNQFQNRLKLETFVVIIVLVIAVFLSGLCVYIWQDWRRIKPLLKRYKKASTNTKQQNHAVNKASILDTQELIDQVDDRLKEMYNSWDAEAKKYKVKYTISNKISKSRLQVIMSIIKS
jgi:flagellar motility protein MotE (MotC chaperone)